MSRVTDSLTGLEKAYVSLRLTAATRPFVFPSRPLPVLTPRPPAA